MSQLHKEAKEAVHVYIYSCVPVSGWAGGEADMRWQHLGLEVLGLGAVSLSAVSETISADSARG